MKVIAVGASVLYPTIRSREVAVGIDDILRAAVISMIGKYILSLTDKIPSTAKTPLFLLSVFTIEGDANVKREAIFPPFEFTDLLTPIHWPPWGGSVNSQAQAPVWMGSKVQFEHQWYRTWALLGQILKVCQLKSKCVSQTSVLTLKKITNYTCNVDWILEEKNHIY